MRLLPLLLAIVAAILLYRYAQTLPPHKRKALLWSALPYTLIAVILLLVAIGKAHWLGLVFAALIALFKFGFTLSLKSGLLAKFLQSKLLDRSKLQSQFLNVEIDLKSGKIEGMVKLGPHSGKTFAQLDDEARRELLAYYQVNDKFSFYLARFAFGLQSEKHQNAYGQQNNTAYNEVVLSREEAEMILGLKSGYSVEDLDLAYKKIIQRVHPDRGGNDYLAAKVNAARDILLKNLKV